MSDWDDNVTKPKQWQYKSITAEEKTIIKGIAMALPRYYANATTPENKEYEYTPVEWRSPDHYDICKRIGRGKYSEVFSGVMVNSHGSALQDVVIKVLKPVKKRKQRREIYILKMLRGGPNIVNLLDVVRDPISRTPSLIYEAIDSVNFQDVSSRLSAFDTSYYFFQILLSLDYCNSKGIMHRDVKPHNIILDANRRVIRLVDWGLAEFYTPGEEFNVRVASRYYKAPELLIDFRYYDYSLDMWALGCMFAAIIFCRDPFFVGIDNSDQLVKITDILGTQDLFDYCEKVGIKLERSMINKLGNKPRREFHELITDSCDLASEAALEFVDAMLRYDHQERICPREALFLPYFEGVRQLYTRDHGVNWNLDPEIWKPLVYAANASREASSLPVKLNLE